MEVDNLEERHRQFIEDVLHCALCGHELEIHVLPITDSDLVREEAHCKHCSIKTRTKNHTIQ